MTSSPIPERIAAHWHQTPQARALIARLSPGEVIERRRPGIPADFTIMLGRTDQAVSTLTALEELRAVAPVIELGYDFASTQQPYDEDRVNRFIDCMGTAPDVRSVVLAAFRERIGEAA